MENEKIKQILIDIVINKNLFENDFVALINHYAFERKGKNLPIHPIHVVNLFGQDVMIKAVVDYYFQKFNAILITEIKTNKNLKIHFAN